LIEFIYTNILHCLCGTTNPLLNRKMIFEQPFYDNLCDNFLFHTRTIFSFSLSLLLWFLCQNLHFFIYFNCLTSYHLKWLFKQHSSIKYKCQIDLSDSVQPPLTQFKISAEILWESNPTTRSLWFHISPLVTTKFLTLCFIRPFSFKICVFCLSSCFSYFM